MVEVGEIVAAVDDGLTLGERPVIKSAKGLLRPLEVETAVDRTETGSFDLERERDGGLGRGFVCEISVFRVLPLVSGH